MENDLLSTNHDSADKEVFGASRLSIFEWLVYAIILLGVCGAEAVVMLNFGHVYGLTFVGAFAQVGAVAGGLALIILPLKIFKATVIFTPQWWLSVAFLLIEAIILSGNVTVAYNTMSGVTLSEFELAWRHLVPATSLIAAFGAALVFISNPYARVVAVEMAAKIIYATSYAEGLADKAKMALHRARLDRKRIMIQEEIEANAAIVKMQNEAALAQAYQAEYLAATKQDEDVIKQLRAGAKERARIDAMRITGQLLGITLIEGTAKELPSVAPIEASRETRKPVRSVQRQAQPSVKPGTRADTESSGWAFDIELIRSEARKLGKVKDLESATGKALDAIQLSDLESVASKYGVSLERAMRYVGVNPESVKKALPK